MHTFNLGLVALATAAASACNFPTGQYCEGEALPMAEEAPTQQARIVAQVNPVEHNAVDLLFVIDDSRSMTDEQQQLGAWSSELFDVLSPLGELPDLHLAVISSSVSIPGLPGCELGNDGLFNVGRATVQPERYLRDVAGPAGRERNYQGSLTEAFAQMARVGDLGCGFEQPFKATRLALSGSMPGSEGFLRDDALLLVVFVTDEDDCSAIDPGLFADVYADACSALGPITSFRCFEHGVRCYDGKGSRAFGERDHCRPDEDSAYMESVSGFASYLKGLKKDPGQVVVAGVYGKPHQVDVVRDERIPSYLAPRLADVCRNGGVEGTGATPAVRMNALMAEFAARASQSSICESELSWALRDLGLVARAAASRSRCLRGSVTDLRVQSAGVQPICRVESVSDVGTSLELRTKVPPCESRQGDSRCFRIDLDPLGCPDTESQLAVHVPDGQDNESLFVTCKVDLPGASVPNPRRDTSEWD